MSICTHTNEPPCEESPCRAPSPGGKLGLGVRLGIGILVVGQSMIFGLALNLHEVPQQVRWFTQNLILCATLLVIVLLGGPLVRAAVNELRRGRLTIEALFLLTMTGAMAASLQAHITGRGKIYFEVVSVLLVVYTLGRLIGSRSRAAALASSRAWGDQLCTCRLVDEVGRTRSLPVEEIMPGDIIEVHPGEMIAVDGVIRDGVGFVSDSFVTGEPFAVVRRPGDHVLAGCASFDATFRIATTVKGTERQVDRLLSAVEEARDKPLSLQARADAIGRWFLPLVVFTALGTFTYWTFLTPAGWEAGLFNAMSVLLVACPCVIGLATPIVIWSALGRLAERGVIVRSGDAIERLATVDRVMFDKTGTLTEDRFTLLDIETTSTGEERAKLLGWLALVQSQSNHPVAKSFAELPRFFEPGAEPCVDSLKTVPGCGVLAELVEANSRRHEIKIGTQEWIGSEDPPPQPPPLQGEGSKAVVVEVDGELAAVAVVAERLRTSTPEAIAHFAQLGLPLEVLTGDTLDRAKALNLPTTRAGLLPDDKRSFVEAAKAEDGKPLFIGDGINDASALATAHVGVALASGTDLAVSAAQITLHGNDLRAIPWAVELSRDAVRAVRRNLSRALCYNVVGMTLAACGMLHPVVAAVLMVVSSLTLIFSSTRVGPTPQPPPCREGEQSIEVSEFSLPATSAYPSFSPSLQGGGWGVGRTLAHALAFALQGVGFLLLLASARHLPSAVFLIGAFALVGIALAYCWHRWSTIPHSADMCFGMLTFGNLGMLLGWWADNGFSALPAGGCCKCVEAMRSGVMKPWMWVGMLVFANVAMRWFSRRPTPGGCHAIAMFSGGNVGMVFGMIAGGWCASQFETARMTLAVATNFVGMTAGMLAGMLLGTWLVEQLCAFACVAHKRSMWFTKKSSHTA